MLHAFSILFQFILLNVLYFIVILFIFYIYYSIVFSNFCTISATIISFRINKLLTQLIFQFDSHIKKKLAHITEYVLPHRHDNSHLRRRHKLDQLPSCLSSSKC